MGAIAPNRCAALLTLALLLLTGWLARAVEEYHADLCVYGATSGGVIAAVQAARLGKQVVLVSVNQHLGGMSSGGLGQTDIGNFGDSYIQGIAREFYTRVGQKYGTGPTFAFEPHVAETVFRELAQQAGVRLCTNQHLVSVLKQGTQLVALTMDSGDVFRARMFVDASYEGDLLAKAGVTYTLGREASAQYGESLNGIRTPNTGGHQFGSLNISPYVLPNDPASGLLPLVQSNAPATPGAADSRVQAYNFRLCLTQTATNQLPLTAPPNYDPTQYELLARYIQALQAQGTSPSLASFMNVFSMPHGKTDINNNGPVSTDFIGQSSAYPEADEATRAQIWQAHKNYLQGFLYFLATDPRVPTAVQTQIRAYGLCKDEFIDTAGWPYQLYVREARRMVSDYVMTQSNCLGLAVAPDSVGLAAYAMDSHNCQRVVVGGLVQNEGDTYTAGGIPGPFPISYRALVPKPAECTNLLVPCCLSASHIAFGSIRMEPVFMVLGQAAGTAAALALNDALPVQNLSVAKLQAQLLADGQALGSSNSFTVINGIIVDDADSKGVTTVGSWTASTSTGGYYAKDYLHDGNANKGLSTVTFTPTLPSDGTYAVYARWPSLYNRAASVPIDIIHPAGTNTVYVNQTQQGAQWVLLLTTNFPAGTAAQVRIRNTGTSGYVIADAVMFSAATNRPTVCLWTANGAACRFGSQPGRLTLGRTGDTTSALTIYLTFGGTARAGVDYAPLPSAITLPAGIAFSNLLIAPLTNPLPQGDKTLLVSLLPNAAYAISSLASATFTVADLPLFDWRLQYFGAQATNSAIAGDNASPAGDGIPNLLKYALGLDPTRVHQGPLLTPVFNAEGYFAVAYTRPDPPPQDIAYQVEVSHDLKTWCADSSCTATDQVLIQSNLTLATVTVRDLTGPGASSFLRLRVNRK